MIALALVGERATADVFITTVLQPFSLQLYCNVVRYNCLTTVFITIVLQPATVLQTIVRRARPLQFIMAEERKCSPAVCKPQ